MKLLLTGASGNIGAKIGQILLNQNNHQLRLFSRHPEKLVIEQAHGAEVFRGDLVNEADLLRAAQGCDALFLMIPPHETAANYRDFQNRAACNAALAIEKNKIKHVVLLSAYGAQLTEDLGIINGLRDVENIMRQVAPNLSVLRPGFLMENFLLFLNEMRQALPVTLSISSSVKIPMIASQDIAEAAARLLNRENARGQTIYPLYGPREYEIGQAVEMLGVALDRKLAYQEVGTSQLRMILEDKGMSENYAAQLVEYFDALDIGLLTLEHPRNEMSTTPTSIQEFAQMVLQPILSEAANIVTDPA